MSIGVAPFLDPKPLRADDIEGMNIFVSVETDEDVPYLARALGEQTLTVGTDFGHNDLGTELGAHQTILARQDIAPELAAKMVDANGRKLYGVDPQFRPARKQACTAVPHVEAAAGGPPIVVPSWVRDQPRRSPELQPT